ncbi:glycosyltransferase [Umezawaea endophytica]|uniref:Glycosyltransferase n=1 Tax=Umezawaea endophytica TaxID=1654476 RepID=A0A9X2VFV8_9PSEU|nr:glycosyltransferase [Umezawaea endophytica]MCS7475908.1 glycosyltransferase [Umezawaea endophytica]
MRIAMGAASWEVDTDERRTHISELSHGLARGGHHVTLYTRRDSPGPFRRGPQRLVRVPAGPAARLTEADLLPHLDEFAANLDKHWGGHPPDVAHLHSWTSGLAVRALDIPVVQSFHGLRATRQRPSAGVRGLVEIERLVGLAADHVITANDEERTALAFLGIPRERMTLATTGVDTDHFRPGGATWTRRPGHRLLGLGDVEPHSGFYTTIGALPRVPDAELLITGRIRHAVPRDSPEVTRLLRHARDLGVADRVRFTGPVGRADLPALLRSADVVVRVPSHDPLGTPALRVMACGVPVVASAVGALRDLVVDTTTGLLVPPRVPTVLGRALRDLLAEPVRRNTFAVASTDRARSAYSWARVVATTVDAYRKAISAGSRRRGTRSDTR